MSELSHLLPGFAPDPDPARRAEYRRVGRQKKRRRRRRTGITVLLLLVVLGGGIGGAYLGLAPVVRSFMEPKDYTGTGTGTVRVKIPQGASGRTISKVLLEAGVIKTQVAYIDAATANLRSSSVQPGTYDLRRQMSAASALAVLLDPDNRKTVEVTIREGARAKDVLLTLAKALDLPVADLVKASRSAAIGLPVAARGRPEGFLFPATYDFEPDATATEVLSAMVQRSRAEYRAIGLRASTLRAVVTKASIIQAEAGSEADMGKISRVLSNRLKAGKPLQLDTTVSYAVQRFGVTTTPAERKSPSRFNTYRYPGLPIGPICNPGSAALRAAVKPVPGKWMYFVAVNPTTGETRFAETYEEHLQNTRQFQEWLRAN